jgi:energy-coupling factor transporter ATP-binding protein EcfA2
VPTLDTVKINISKRLPESNHFNSKWVRDRYDLDVKIYEKSWKFEFKFPNEWQIGLIVGNSGSGKSLIARHIFGTVYQDRVLSNVEVPLVEAMGSHDMQDIINALTHVGMGSTPEWITPYQYLSTGQKMRADIAFCLLNVENLIVFDEFTSVVDRQVAKVVSHSVAKAFRKKHKQFVAVTCHHDVEEWLEPDWVLDMDLKEFRDSKKKDRIYPSRFAPVKGRFGMLSKIITI